MSVEFVHTISEHVNIPAGVPDLQTCFLIYQDDRAPIEANRSYREGLAACPRAVAINHRCAKTSSGVYESAIQ